MSKVEDKLKEWAEALGKPVAELTKLYEENLTMFKKNMPGKPEDFYVQMARSRVFITIKSELTSPAKPFDVVWLGYSASLDVNAVDMAEKKLLWQNPQTKAQAIAEGKVSSEGVPLDTREWMIAPDPSKNVKGRKNRNFGKSLTPALIRNYIGVGRPAMGGNLKIISLTAMGEERIKLLPQKSVAVRTRLNVRSEDDLRYICNMSTTTRFDQQVSMPEIPDQATLLQLLETCPLHVPLAELPAWHELHEKDARRVVIISGDVTYVSPEPTRFGSYLIVIEDASREDLKAEGTTIFSPEEPDFGRNSKIYAIGRTTIGPGRNPDTGEFDPGIEKVNMNAVAVFAIPEFRVPPEEESVIEGAVEVK